MVNCHVNAKIILVILGAESAAGEVREGSEGQGREAGEDIGSSQTNTLLDILLGWGWDWIKSDMSLHHHILTSSSCICCQQGIIMLFILSWKRIWQAQVQTWSFRVCENGTTSPSAETEEFGIEHG